MSADAVLSDAQKAAICGVLRLGCARVTACRFVGATEQELQVELQRDAAFAREVLRAQATVEIRHLANLHQAGQDVKNWRASAWWLERRATERASDASADDARALVTELVDELARIIVAEVPDAAVHRRLIERLLRVVAGHDEPEPAADAKPLLLPAPKAPTP